MSVNLDLPTSIDQLPEINQGVSRVQYDQHAPTKEIVGDSFPKGAIHTRFEISGTKRWVPSKSYIRMRCSLTKGDGKTQLNISDDVAPNMGLMSNLFQSMEFRIADKTVSRVSDYVAQVDALKTRTSKSRAWLESTGKSTNHWGSDRKKRQAKTAIDGKELSGAVDDVPATRLQMGLDAAGGAGNNRNALSYVDATGVVTLALNGGAALAQSTAELFPIGSYFYYNAIEGAVAGDARLNVRVRVLTTPTPTTLTVAIGSLGADVAVDGRTDFIRILAQPDNSARRVKTFEMVWQPPLSIFDVDQALPAGKYELILNPQVASSYKKRVIESLLGNRVAGTEFNFNVVDMFLYTATLESTRVDDITYMIDLDEVRCQTDNSKTGGGLQQKNFDVSPSSYALAVAFQHSAVGSDTRYSSSKLKIAGEELQLTRMYVSYAGQSKPSPDCDPEFKAGDAIDYTTQRYADSLLQSGQFSQEGGSETLEEWQERGAYYYFAWMRDGADRSTRAQVNFQFTPTLTADARVLLFDLYKSIAQISVKDGRVTNVTVMDT